MIMTDFVRNTLQSYATINSHDVKIIHISSENNDMLIAMISILTIFMITSIIIAFLAKNVIHKHNELQQDLENLKKQHSIQRKLISNKNNNLFNKKISKIQEIIAKVDLLENQAKKLNLEINNENLTKFNLLKERFFNQYQKILELDDLSETVIKECNYSATLDEYAKSMYYQYEQLQQHFNIQIKENVDKEIVAIKLINQN